MKKFLLIGGSLVVVLAVVAVFALQFLLGSVVTAAVNGFAPKLTGTPVTLESARINPLTGSGTLTGFVVGNPEGWTSDRAFSLGRIHVDMKPFSLFGDHIVIEEILIEQPDFVYETKLVSSNIGDLLDNIEAASGGGDKPAPEADSSGDEPIKFEVRHFALTGGSVTLGVGATALKIPMVDIELNNLGTDNGGITPNELAVEVMQSVTASVVSATTEAASQVGSTMGAAAGNAVGGAAQKAGDAIRGLFNKD